MEPCIGSNNSYPFYPHVFKFEQCFDPMSTQNWVQNNWMGITGWAGTAYVTLVFAGQAWMVNRLPYNLRLPLASWSAFLAIFSMVGFLRTFPEFIHSLLSSGLYGSVCDNSYLHSHRVSSFWTWLFTLSKVPELGDTLFIVLRKQQLIFLHWYHHLTVLIYVFYCFSEFTSCARWFMVMNYFVHSVMYSYYALRALRVRPPKGVAIMITSLQLIQMLVGCFINYTAYQYKQAGLECHVTESNLAYSSIMYSTYFVLFARFFYNAYLSKSEKKDKDTSHLVNRTATNVGNLGEEDKKEK